MSSWSNCVSHFCFCHLVSLQRCFVCVWNCIVFLFGRLCLIKAVLCLLLVVLCLFVVVLFLYGMLTAVLKACVSQFSQSANCSLNILYTVEIKTQRNKGTACPRQILTRKEFKNWHVWRLRVEPQMWWQSFSSAWHFSQDFKHTSVSWEKHLSSAQAGLCCVDSKARWGPCSG